MEIHHDIVHLILCIDFRLGTLQDTVRKKNINLSQQTLNIQDLKKNLIQKYNFFQLKGLSDTTVNQTINFKYNFFKYSIESYGDGGNKPTCASKVE